MEEEEGYPLDENGARIEDSSRPAQKKELGDYSFTFGAPTLTRKSNGDIFEKIQEEKARLEAATMASSAPKEGERKSAAASAEETLPDASTTPGKEGWMKFVDRNTFKSLIADPTLARNLSTIIQKAFLAYKTTAAVSQEDSKSAVDQRESKYGYASLVHANEGASERKHAAAVVTEASPRSSASASAATPAAASVDTSASAADPAADKQAEKKDPLKNLLLSLNDQAFGALLQSVGNNSDKLGDVADKLYDIAKKINLSPEKPKNGLDSKEPKEAKSSGIIPAWLDRETFKKFVANAKLTPGLVFLFFKILKTHATINGSENPLQDFMKPQDITFEHFNKIVDVVKDDLRKLAPELYQAMKALLPPTLTQEIFVGILGNKELLPRMLNGLHYFLKAYFWPDDYAPSKDPLDLSQDPLDPFAHSAQPFIDVILEIHQFTPKDVSVKASHIRGNLDAHSGSQLRSKASEAVAHFSRDILVHMIKQSKLDPNKKEWTDVFHMQALGLPVGKLAEKLTISHGKLIIDAIDANVLKGLDNFTKAINDKQKEDKDYTAKLFHKMVKGAADHFTQVNTITKNNTRSLTDAKMRAEMQNTRLAAVPDVGVDSIGDAAGKAAREQGFYKDLGDEILKLMFPNGAKDLEIPDLTWIKDSLKKAGMDIPLTKEEIWKLLKQQMPAIIHIMFSTVASRHILNTSVLSGLENMMPSVDPNARPADPKPAAAKKPPFVVPNDDLQKAINEDCRKLIAEFIRVFPHTLANTALQVKLPFFSTDAFAGNLLGKILREQAQTWDLNRMIDTGILSGIPNWHQGEWRKLDGTKMTNLDVVRRDLGRGELTFKPMEVVRDEEGYPLDENGARIEDSSRPAQKKELGDYSFTFGAPTLTRKSNGDILTVKQATEDTIKNNTVGAVEKKLQDKIDNVLQGTFSKAIPTWTQKAVQGFLWVIASAVKVVAFALALIPMILIRSVKWNSISTSIDDAIKGPWKKHLVKQRERAMRLLHLDANEALINRIAKDVVGAIAIEPAPAAAAPAAAPAGAAAPAAVASVAPVVPPAAVANAASAAAAASAVAP